MEIVSMIKEAWLSRGKQKYKIMNANYIPVMVFGGIIKKWLRK